MELCNDANHAIMQSPLSAGLGRWVDLDLCFEILLSYRPRDMARLGKCLNG